MLGEGARESEGEGKQFFCNRLWEERDQWVNLEGIQLNLYVRLIIQC